MKVIRFLIFLSTVLAFVACEQTPSINIAKERVSLLAADSAFAKASVETNAAEAFKMFLAEDAIQMPNGAMPVNGINAIYEMLSEDVETYTLTWEPQDGDVASSGDMGWTWGLAEFTIQPKAGEKRTSYSKYLNVWIKDFNGEWKVKVDIGNSAPAPSDTIS